MATTKKATNGKAAPGKAKAKVAAAPRIDYKAGARVKVQRRTGTESKGIVTEVITKQTGAFICVNIGRKDEPNIIKARPVTVRGY